MFSTGTNPSRFSAFVKMSGIHKAFMPNAGSRVSSPRRLGLRAVADNDEHVAQPKLRRCDHRSMNLDLITLRRNGKVFDELDKSGNDETVLLGELAPHLGDAQRQIAGRAHQDGRNLLPKQISISVVFSCSRMDWRDCSSAEGTSLADCALKQLARFRLFGERCAC